MRLDIVSLGGDLACFSVMHGCPLLRLPRPLSRPSPLSHALLSRPAPRFLRLPCPLLRPAPLSYAFPALSYAPPPLSYAFPALSYAPPLLSYAFPVLSYAPSSSLTPFSHAPAISLTPCLSSHTPFRVGVVGVSMSRWGVRRMHTHVHVDAH